MKFLVDANLPFTLALILKIKGFDVIHTDNLPNKEQSTDREIRSISQQQDRIVISKDTDF
jgi:predicted nuclease of predicted toxin-antitoxin system